MSSSPIGISRTAKVDVARTLAYLGEYSPMAAARLSEALERAILTLGQFPSMGRLRPRATLVLVHRALGGRMDVETEIQNDRAP